MSGSGTAKRLCLKAQGCFNPGGNQVQIIVNPERVVPPDATAWRLNRPFNPVTQGSRSGIPWALRRNRFAVKQFKPEAQRGIHQTTLSCTPNLNSRLTNAKCRMENRIDLLGDDENLIVQPTKRCPC